MRLLLAALMLLSPVSTVGQPASSTVIKSHRYAVIFRVTTDGAGGISALQVERVIDPSGPGTEEEVAKRAVDVAVPATYIAAARAFLERRERERAEPPGTPKTYYTYTIYDPAQPERTEY